MRLSRVRASSACRSVAGPITFPWSVKTSSPFTISGEPWYPLRPVTNDTITKTPSAPANLARRVVSTSRQRNVGVGSRDVSSAPLLKTRPPCRRVKSLTVSTNGISAGRHSKVTSPRDQDANGDTDIQPKLNTTAANTVDGTAASFSRYFPADDTLPSYPLAV